MILKRIVYGDAMKKLGLYILLAGCILLFAACSVQKDSAKKLKDAEFTVVDARDVPEELKEQIEEEKEETFELTYGDEGYLYIARGYGKQDTSGYSVEVKECYETSNTICMKTNLLGPPKEEEIVEKATYPYVVIKLEYSDKSIVFK